MTVSLISRNFFVPTVAIIDSGEVYGITYTEGIISRIEAEPDIYLQIRDSLIRHISGDWGDIDSEDKALNDRYPDEALSAYTIKDNLKIWIKTENGSFIVLLPSEY